LHAHIYLTVGIDTLQQVAFTLFKALAALIETALGASHKAQAQNRNNESQ
jgi:hypothetical protein